MPRTESTEPDSSRRIVEHPILGTLPEAQSVTITIDGQSLTARDGEPIAAALLAHGITVCRTAPESGETRGPFCAVGRCPDCLMTVDGVLNVRACLTSVRDGMRVETQIGLGQWEGGAS
jgi:predicted molibdopterin-dependent oxidoreductase YjgC